MKKLLSALTLLLALSLLLCSCLDLGSLTNVLNPASDDETEVVSPAAQTPSAATDSTPSGEEETDAIPVDPAPQNGFTQSYQDSLMTKIPSSVDIGLGWEFRDLTVNGKFRRVAAQFEMDSSVIPTDPCFTYYYVDVHGEDLPAEALAVGRAFFSDETTAFVRGYEDPDELALINFELFEYNFKASTFQGKDKEYIVFSIPASWEPNTATMVIASDDGKRLADTVVNKSYPVTLSGEDADKYKDHGGNANFFSFNEGAITYLKVSQRVDGVTYLTEYSVTVENNQITSAETGRIYQTTDAVPDLAGLSVY